ncbi:hypothetical protein [Agarivorans gilvus]|uniref:Uncharacterized protein n=1 Tax=Agarivorans gilvus TaxID=680279 RepID=A0ABQ1I8C7_9ALTE|nr:hypothetical protein [Agarivorans gilvus]GGB22470.1 hypothetical protein GCM10007414_39740 [Agarivorans gilvus]
MASSRGTSVILMLSEQKDDVIAISNYLLDRFSEYAIVDSSPEGRLQAQLLWVLDKLKEPNFSLPLPAEQLSTLRYIYTDGTLSFHASDPDDINSIFEEIELPLVQLIKILKKGQLLIKPEYYPHISRVIEALIFCLKNATRVLSTNEVIFLKELEELKLDIDSGKQKLPFQSHLPRFPGYTAVGGFGGNSIDDIPKAKELYKIFDGAVFCGNRPLAWINEAAAKQAVEELIINS